MHSIFLRYFDEVVRQGSIRKAALILNISSTSVNLKILSVEEQLGVKLFERNPEGIKLTQVGALVLEHCRKTLLDYDRTRVTIDEFRDLRTGHVSVSTVDSIANSILPEALERFTDSTPGVSISVIAAQPDEVLEAVASGAADIGVGFGYSTHPDVRIASEKSSPLGVLLRADRPLSERRSLMLEDLTSYNLVRTIDARGHKSIIDQNINDMTAHLTTRYFTNTLSLAKRMILDGKGIGIYTKIGFHSDVASGSLRFIPLLDKGIVDLKIGVFVSSKLGMDPAKQLLCAAIESALSPLILDS